MKKILSLAVLSIYTCVMNATAQVHYLKIGTGYSFAMPGQTEDLYGGVIDGSVSKSTTTPTVTKYNLKSASFSSGLQLQVGVGYLFTKNVGAELCAYMNVTTNSYSAVHTGLVNSSNNTFDLKIDRKTNNLILLIPSLVIQTADTNINLYMKMGIAAPFNSGMQMTHTLIYPNSFQTNKFTWDVKNYISLGMSASCGVSVRLNNTIRLSCEANMMHMSLYVKKAIMRTANLNGNNVAPSNLTGGKTTHNYVKNATETANGTYEQTYSQPYSNIGLNVGLSFRL